MNADSSGTKLSIKNLGWQVTFAGLGINLALGVLYSWSVISAGLEKQGWEWAESASNRSWPYAVACLVFCLSMVPAGRLQDKIGPRLTASIGGILVGIGMILTSYSDSLMGYIIGFGVLTGMGIGFAYASATPPAVKWFPKAKTGLIAGIVVAGFGVASVYIAPLCDWLIGKDGSGLSSAVFVLGIGFLVAVVGLAQLLTPPPKDYDPEVDAKGSRFGDFDTFDESNASGETSATPQKDFSPLAMLGTWQFYLIWFMYACGAGAGLMIISVAKGIGKQASVGTALVVGLAIGNGAGRVFAGFLSDKIGRPMAMFLFFVCQAALVVLLSFASAPDSALNTAFVLIGIAALVGANYGSNLTLFPSIAKDFYGTKNFGLNYGLIFTAWGIGGFLLAKFAGMVRDGKVFKAMEGSYDFAYYTAAALLIVAALTTFVLRAPRHESLDAIENDFAN